MPSTSESPPVAQDGVLCGSCRAYGYCRLGVGPIAIEGDMARATAVCAETFHAGPRVAHGGWTAAVFDDVIGRSLVQRGTLAVTASLTTEFLKPVPVEEPLAIEVTIEAQEGRRWTMAAVLRLAAGDAPLARAHGVWVERRPDHFERHDAAMRTFRRGTEPS